MATEFLSANTWRFNEFTFDLGTRMLLRDGVECRLSPKALQLLRALLIARPRAVSRKDLYDELWPSTYVCETNLATIVNELRRALGDQARDASFVRTVHGFGYAFCADAETVTPDAAAATLRCEGRDFPLYDGENVVGRNSQCDIVLADKTVSRRHATITVDGDTIQVRDLESRNGTYIEGERVSWRRVARHERIGFGAVIAVLSSEAPPSTTPALLLSTQFRNEIARLANS